MCQVEHEILLTQLSTCPANDVESRNTAVCRTDWLTWDSKHVCVSMCLQYFSRLTKTAHLVSKASLSLVRKWWQLQLHWYRRQTWFSDDPWPKERKWNHDVTSVTVCSTQTYKLFLTSAEHHTMKRSSDAQCMLRPWKTCKTVSRYFLFSVERWKQLDIIINKTVFSNCSAQR